MEHLQSEEPFSSDPYFSNNNKKFFWGVIKLLMKYPNYSLLLHNIYNWENGPRRKGYKTENTNFGF